MVKLRPRDIAALRAQLLSQQQGLCALCLEPCAPAQAVLDHDHSTGHIRGVLHRGCNSFEGQVVRSLPRNLITPQRLRRILLHWHSYHEIQRPWLHPQHRDPEQKKALALARARARRAQNRSRRQDPLI